MLTVTDCRRLLERSSMISAVALAREKGVAFSEIERLFHEVRDTCADVELTCVVSWERGESATRQLGSEGAHNSLEKVASKEAVAAEELGFTRDSIVMCTSRNEAEALCAAQKGLTCTVYQLRSRHAACASSLSNIDTSRSLCNAEVTTADPSLRRTCGIVSRRPHDTRPYPLVWRSSFETDSSTMANVAPMCAANSCSSMVKTDVVPPPPASPVSSPAAPVAHASLQPKADQGDAAPASCCVQRHVGCDEASVQVGSATQTNRTVPHNSQPEVSPCTLPSLSEGAIGTSRAATSAVMHAPQVHRTTHDVSAVPTTGDTAQATEDAHTESTMTTTMPSSLHDNTVEQETCATSSHSVETAALDEAGASTRKRPLSVFDIMCSASSPSSVGATAPSGRGKKPRKEQVAAPDRNGTIQRRGDADKAAAGTTMAAVALATKQSKKSARERKAEALSTCKSLAKLARASAKNARAKAAGAAANSNSTAARSRSVHGMLDEEEDDDSGRTRSVCEDGTLSSTDAPYHSFTSVSMNEEGAMGSGCPGDDLIYGIPSTFLDVQITAVNDDIILCDQAPPLAFCSPEKTFTSAPAVCATAGDGGTVPTSPIASAVDDKSQQRTLSSLFNPAVVAFQKQYAREMQTDTTFVKGEYVCQDVACYRHIETSEIISEVEFHRRTAEVANNHTSTSDMKSNKNNVGKQQQQQCHTRSSSSPTPEGADAATVATTVSNVSLCDAAHSPGTSMRNLPEPSPPTRKKPGGGVRVSKQAPPLTQTAPAKGGTTLLSFFRQSQR